MIKIKDKMRYGMCESPYFSPLLQGGNEGYAAFRGCGHADLPHLRLPHRLRLRRSFCLHKFFFFWTLYEPYVGGCFLPYTFF